MATVKLPCPKCSSTGLTGEVVAVVCTQCNGTGMISVQDTDTISTVNASLSTKIVITIPIAVPNVSVRSLSRGR